MPPENKIIVIFFCGYQHKIIQPYRWIAWDSFTEWNLVGKKKRNKTKNEKKKEKG